MSERVRNEDALNESESKDALLTDMIKATKNLIESTNYERAANDSSYETGLTTPINFKSFKYLANTVDNLIGMSRDVRA